MFEQFRNDAVYNTSAVVQRTGIPADTVRAWERRYGIPVPQRSVGNQRLYSERDIATIVWLRDQTREGLTISQAVALLRAHEHQHATNRGDNDSALREVSHSSTPSGSEDAYHQVQRKLADSLSRFDGRSADIIIEEALAFLSIEDVCLQVMAQALQTIGDEWERGDLTVAEEHFASRFIHRKLVTQFNASSPDSGAGPILAACVADEQHETGLLLTSLFLSRRGYRITYLGADIPDKDLVATMQTLKPIVVLLSATTESGALKLGNTVQQLSEINQARAENQRACIGFGGGIFATRPDLRTGIDGLYLGANAQEATRCISDMMMSHTFPKNACITL